MKCLRRVFACFCKKKGDQKDSDEPMIFDDSPRSEEIQGRAAAGGHRKRTNEEKLMDHDAHAEDLARLPWNSIKVYTDAAIEREDRKKDKNAESLKGIGGWFGTNDPRNFDQKLEGTESWMKETSYLELLAIEEALEKVKTKYCCQPVIFFADNETAVDYLMDIRKPKHKPKDKNNQEIVEMYEAIQCKVNAIKKTMENFIGGVEVKHVTGHSGIFGNEEADKRATRHLLKEPTENARAEPTGNARAEPTENARAEPTENARAEPTENDRAEPTENVRAEESSFKKKEDLLVNEYDREMEKWYMAERAKHANEIAQLEWSKIVVYTAVNQETRRYSGWLGTHHPLNFVKTTSSEDFEESCLMAIKEALNMLRDSKYYHGELVCIVTNDVRFENFKGGEVPTDLPGSGKVEIEKLIDQLAGAVEFKFVGKDWQIPGDKKARALTIEHHDDCPEK